MSSSTYSWERLWSPLGAPIRFGDNGFLTDPESEWGRYANPDLKSFDAIASVPCLVLLGEPGMGKSRALWDAYVAVSAREQAHWIDLKDYGSDATLHTVAFGDAAIRDWRNGSHRLHLFIDSLDEGALAISALSNVLKRELRTLPAERLSVYIACRTLDWPMNLQAALVEQWGNGNVTVYELAPLRRADVVTAAVAKGIDVDAFLDEVERLSVIPFAMRPLTLDALLTQYLDSGTIGITTTAIYHDYCRRLCREMNPDRVGAGLVGQYDQDARMAVAARVAVVTMFANRIGIVDDPFDHPMPEGFAALNDLYGGSEPAGNQTVAIDRQIVQEALSTGLFKALAPGQIAWAHRTFEEYLAAYYLSEHEVAIDQVRSLLFHSNDPQHKLVPQLRQTAAWLAEMNRDVFRAIMTTDPEVLLRSNVGIAADDDRTALVTSVLRSCDEGRILDTFGFRAGYANLAHPELLGQLQPYLTDRGRRDKAREVAIDMAEACNLAALFPVIVAIALDPEESLNLRVHAACAISLTNDPVKALLKPLITQAADDDRDDQLKGCALRGLWPDHLTATELFAALTLPKRDSLYGTYQGFLGSGFEKRLAAADIPIALTWVANQRRADFHLARTMDAILIESWKHMDLPDVPTAFAQAVLARYHAFHKIIFDHRLEPEFHDTLMRDTEMRQRLVEAMLPLLIGTEHDARLLVYGAQRLVTADDLAWLLERLAAATSEESKSLLVNLIQWSADLLNPAHSEALFLATERNAFIAAAFGSLFMPIALDSPQAQAQRSQYEEVTRWQRDEPEQQVLEPPLVRRVERLLDAYEAGDIDAFWRAIHMMMYLPNGWHSGNEFESDLTKLPGWAEATGETRARIGAAAKSYLHSQTPQPQQWVPKTKIIVFRPDMAGFRALRLLLSEDREWLDRLPAEVWRTWAPVILAYSERGSADATDVHRDLTTRAYRHAPHEILQTLLTLIDVENRRDGYVTIVERVSNCWDDRLAQALLQKAKDGKLKPRALATLLSHLLEHRVAGAIDIAIALSRFRRDAGALRREKATVAVQALIAHTPEEGWQAIRDAIDRDVEFGKQIFRDLAYQSAGHAEHVAQQLTESQLADLYIWLTRQYPPEEDPQIDGAHSLDTREMIGHWRDGLLRNLQGRGTLGACGEIERIIDAFPRFSSLRWVLMEAQDEMRRQTWVPYEPAAILAVTRHRAARLVQDGDELLAVLVESLERLNQELQGETPAVTDLWSDIHERVDGHWVTRYQPKDEESLSDYVRRFLVRDLGGRGIVFNREVVIRRSRGTLRGERTDIHVDAIASAPREGELAIVRAIVEVKGCWDDRLPHAMETQLRDRYLRDNQCRHGLYLIGWYICDQWDLTDNRRSRTPAMSVDEARGHFARQAKELSGGNLHIEAFVLNTAIR